MRTYFRIIVFGKVWWKWAFMALIFMGIYTLFSAVSLIAVIPFLEILFGQETAQVPTTPFVWYESSSLKLYGYYYLYKWMGQTDKLTVLFYFCLSLIGAISIKNAARYLAAYCMAPVEFGIVRSLRSHLFHALSRQELGFFTQSKKGDLIGRVVSDVDAVSQAVVSTLQNLVREPLSLLVFFLALLFISWKLTLFSLVILPLTALVINLIARPLKREARKGQEVMGDLISRLDEFISGIRIVKGFQKEAYEREKYEKQNQSYAQLQISIRRRLELASPSTEILSIAIICLIIYYGGSLILQNQPELKAAEFLGFIALFTQFLAPIKLISTAISKIQKGNAAFERIEELMYSPSPFSEVETKATQDGKNPGKPLEFKDKIRFEQVSFSYDGPDVLKQINFEIARGQTIALVGPSGGGKSTIADLMARFYDPTAGKILLDNQDIRTFDLTAYRALFGMVTQEGILFHDTIYQNIAYGMEQVPLEKVIEAAQMANAHEFIQDMPENYQTVIGERGLRLSGGQRQRLAIARAILRNPSVLILDEATSNLDSQAEKLVQDALVKIMSDRTSLIIAHRLSTIQEADLILTIEAGKIVQAGTHESLLNSPGLYQELHRLQFK